MGDSSETDFRLVFPFGRVKSFAFAKRTLVSGRNDSKPGIAQTRDAQICDAIPQFEEKTQ